MEAAGGLYTRVIRKMREFIFFLKPFQGIVCYLVVTPTRGQAASARSLCRKVERLFRNTSYFFHSNLLNAKDAQQEGVRARVQCPVFLTASVFRKGPSFSFFDGGSCCVAEAGLELIVLIG